jgi:hypothetical protein
MPGAGQGLSLTATLCAPLSGGEARTERIEIPGTAPAMHCDYCLSPLTGAAPDFFAPGLQPAVAAAAIATPPPATYPRFALQRSQTPRGPPQA